MIEARDTAVLPKTLEEFMVWEPEDGFNGARSGVPCPRGMNEMTESFSNLLA